MEWKAQVLRKGDPRLNAPDVEIKRIPTIKQRYLVFGYDDEGGELYHPMVTVTARNYLEIGKQYQVLSEQLGKTGGDEEGFKAAISIISAAYPTIEEEQLWNLHFASLLPLAYEAMRDILVATEEMQAVIDSGLIEKLEAMESANIPKNTGSKTTRSRK
jgi:hypothetical protein